MPQSNFPASHNMGMMAGRGVPFGHSSGMSSQYPQPAMVGGPNPRPISHGQVMMRPSNVMQAPGVQSSNMMIRRGEVH